MNKNKIVYGLLVATLCAGIVLPGLALAADNESIALPRVDAHAIVTNGTTNYVSDFNSTNILTLDNMSVSAINAINGDGGYGLYFANGDLFVAAGKYSPAVICPTMASVADVLPTTTDGLTEDVLATESLPVVDVVAPPCILSPASGGLQVFASSDLSAPLSVYGASNFTYSKVSVSGNTAFAAYFDDSYAPKLDPVDYTTPGSPLPIGPALALNPATSATDITGISISGNYAFVSIAGADGMVNVVNISNPATLSLAGTYPTSDAATSVATNTDGSVFYVGHGSKIDVVNTASLSPSSSIDNGSDVNGLFADGTYLYVAGDSGLKVYKLSDNSFAGKFDTAAKPGTAVSADGGYIYLATSDVSNSDIYKIKMVVFSLNPGVACPEPGNETLECTEYKQKYEDPGGTADGTPLTSDSSESVNINNIDYYTVTYTADSSYLQITRRVKVHDTTPPVITLLGDNPQTLKVGDTYEEEGAVTDDGTPVDITYSADKDSFAKAVGTYTVRYDAVDESGNHADQVSRTVEVASSGGGHHGGGRIGGGGGPVIGQVLGAEKFIFTLFLKKGPPYPKGAYMNEVKELQKFLNKVPYNNVLVIDGKFGPLTKAAVVKFQLANGLKGDGLVGQKTRDVLNR